MIKMKINFNSIVLALLGVSIITGIANRRTINELRKTVNDVKENSDDRELEQAEVDGHIFKDIETLEDSVSDIKNAMTEMMGTDETILKSIAGHSAAISMLAEKNKMLGKIEECYEISSNSYDNVKVLKEASRVHRMIDDAEKARTNVSNPYEEK